MRGYKDVVSDAVVNVEASEETVMIEVEDKKTSANAVIGAGESVALAIYLLTSVLNTEKEVEELCSFIKERVVA